MKKSMKAALFSALVFPGAGHFLLKRRAIGWTLICITLLAIVLIIAQPMEAGMALMQKNMESGAMLFDPQIIEELDAVIRAELLKWNAGWIMLIACWLAGIVDSYRIGLMQDQA